MIHKGIELIRFWFYLTFLCFSRSNVLLDGNSLSEDFPRGSVSLNGSLWIGGVDDRRTIPREFPVVNAFKGDVRVLKVNGK